MEAEEKEIEPVEPLCSKDGWCWKYPTPSGSTFRTIWDEFEDRQTPEAKFARGLDRLIELRADGHLQAEASDDILKAVTARLLSRQPAYRCKNCGFSGQTHHWQCPSCRHWSTTRKIQGVLGE